MKKRVLSILLVLVMVITLVPMSAFADTSIALSRPKISSISASSSGVTIKWAAIDGADSYCIKRKVADGSYEELLTVAKTSYTDNSVSHGEEYSYKVCAVKKGTSGLYSAAKTITYNSFVKPTLNSATYSGTTVTLKWDKVAGADGYKIYQKKGSNGSYSLVKTVSNNLINKCSIKNRSVGVAYTYKIKAYSDDGTTSVYSNTKSVTIKLSAPKIETTASATASSVTISWSQVDGATGYYVYRKTSSGSWSKIATIKSASKVSYTNSKISGKYTYAVRAYAVVGSTTYTSGYSSSVYTRTLGSISKFTVKQYADEFAASLSWSKVTGATGYEIYYKVGDIGVWKSKTVTGTSCKMDIDHGSQYHFKVRPIYKSGSCVTNGAFKQRSDVFVLSLEPDYTTRFVSVAGAIGVYVQNNGTEKMRVYSDGAKTVDSVNSANNTTLQLVTIDTGKLSFKEREYINIAAGEEALVGFIAADGSTVGFDNDSTSLVFDFRYDSVIYTATCTKAGTTTTFKEYA